MANNEIKKITCIVPARAGSVGVKNKNTRKIKGRSLIQRAVDLGLALDHNVILSTDVRNALPATYAGRVIIQKRKSGLCTSEAKMQDVVHDVITEFKLNGPIVLLQPTSPLRRVEQLKSIIEIYLKKLPTLLLSVVEEDRSILKNYVRIEDKILPINATEYLFANRQSLPPVYHPNGAFYVFDAQDFLKERFNPKNIEVFVMDDASSLDIDDSSDLVRARLHAEN
jgi:CMP-N,N'-diacetyllegionaminic acid synthase